MVYALFYVFTIQVLWNNYLNDFHFANLLSLVLTMQAITISFRSNKDAMAYVLVVNVLGAILILTSDADITEHSSVIIGSLAVTSILMYSIVHIRSNQLQNTRIKEEFLRIIVSKTEEAILITDFEGYISENNPTALEMFGYDEIELFGKDFSDFRKSKLTKQEDDLGVHALLEDKFWNSEVELLKKSGETFTAFVSISLIKKFEWEFLVYKVRDITSEKLAKSRLTEAKNDAEKALSVKSSFLATMSHEIRTPMNGVIGMTQLLDLTALNEMQSEYVNTVRTCGENLLVIINDILDFSKGESGKIELEMRQFNVQEQTNDVIKLLQKQADEKDVSLKLILGKNVPNQIIGDSTRIRQIITNLLGNALKFTTNGTVQVIVQNKGKEEGKHRLYFGIKDTGIGIHPDKISTLFDSFSQVDSSTTRKFGGTGLGLAICKNLVELMGGELKVISESGKGSTFFFEALFEGFAEESSIKDNNKLGKWDNANGAKLSVLVAEDNLVNQKVAQLLLHSMGIESEIAENGKIALEKMKSKHYDIVFMDVQMPEMDGLEATSLIGETLGVDRKIPVVVAMTANAMEEDRQSCLDAGMIDFVAKPIQKEELVECLLRAFPFSHSIN